MSMKIILHFGFQHFCDFGGNFQQRIFETQAYSERFDSKDSTHFCKTRLFFLYSRVSNIHTQDVCPQFLFL